MLGLRHALDSDHLAAVPTVLAERTSLRASGAIGLWWEIDRTMTLLIVGAIVLALGIRISDEFDLSAESGGELAFVVLGINLAVKLYRDRWHLHAHAHDEGRMSICTTIADRSTIGTGTGCRPRSSPVCIGMAHGLAGSAALMLVTLASTQELGTGLLSIAVFGVGSIVGMMAIGLTISLPLVCSFLVSRRVFVGLQGVAGVSSVGMGVWMLVRQVMAAVGQ